MRGSKFINLVKKKNLLFRDSNNYSAVAIFSAFPSNREIIDEDICRMWKINAAVSKNVRTHSLSRHHS